MFLEVTQAEYLDGYRIKLWFNNNDVRVVDLEASLRGPVFELLKDLDYFRRFRLHFNTIEWPNEADFAPEYLHSIGHAVA